MQQYAENAVQEHMKKLQQSYYTHLGKQEPWDKNPAILKNAIQNSTVYQRLKHQGLAEKNILKILNEKKAMLVYSPEEGEMRGRLFFDRFDQALSEDFASGDDCCGTTIRESKSLGR